MPFQRVASLKDIAEGQGIFVEIHGTGRGRLQRGRRSGLRVRRQSASRGRSLERGMAEGDAAVCPWHGFDFAWTRAAAESTPR